MQNATTEGATAQCLSSTDTQNTQGSQAAPGSDNTKNNKSIMPDIHLQTNHSRAKPPSSVPARHRQQKPSPGQPNQQLVDALITELRDESQEYLSARGGAQVEAQGEAQLSENAGETAQTVARPCAEGEA